MDFQRFHNMPPTGRVTNMTLGMAMVHGLILIKDDSSEKP